MNSASAAAILLEARETGIPIDCLPSYCRPNSIGETYAIHDKLIGKLGLSGWKVNWGEEGVAQFAPLFPISMHNTPAKFISGNIPHKLIEIEIGVRIRKNIGMQHSIDIGDILDSVSLVPLIEILTGRFRDFRKISRMELLSDSNASGAIIVGAPEGGIETPNGFVQVHAQFDDRPPEAISAQISDALNLVVALHQQFRLIGRKLCVGDLIATGTLIKPRSAENSVVAKIPHLGQVELKFI